jgi:hypothetical protein
MPNTDILQKKEWNTKQVITAILIAVSITFSGTMIWGRFLSVETEISTLSGRVEKKDERGNERLDKIEARVTILEQPNTDY